MIKVSTKYLVALLIACFCGSGSMTFAQDSTFIKVNFLYGSKPARKYKGTEKKWFGGKLGGHVGIETDSNVVLNFTPHGSFHLFAKRHNRHSLFAIHSTYNFWAILGTAPENVKRATVIIPISQQQKLKLDSISKAYSAQTPYDYAFIGMRCGAGAYDVLSRINILKQYSYRCTYLRIFYPRKLRRRILKKAKQNNWTVIRQEGTARRKWERD